MRWIATGLLAATLVTPGLAPAHNLSAHSQATGPNKQEQADWGLVGLVGQLGVRYDSATAAASVVNQPSDASATSGDMTEAEVRKIDLVAGKLTLRHAEIKNLDMPAMTMVFVVKDTGMLDKLKAGDRIKFRAVKDAGRLMVTEIVPLP